METPAGSLGRFLLPASILALWLLQGSQAALHIQQIPEHPQKNQNLLLSLHGVPDTFQDFIWYLGEEAYGGTRLFTYIPGLQRPQRDGSAMEHRDIIGFPNGSMLLRRAQPSDSGTYQVAVTINPSWTMKAKTEVQVADTREGRPSVTGIMPLNSGILVAAIIGPLAMGTLLIGTVAYLLVIRVRRRPGLPVIEKPELNPRPETGDSNIYEVVSSPVVLVSPLSELEPVNNSTTTLSPAPTVQSSNSESHHYQDLIDQDSHIYSQLVLTS